MQAELLPTPNGGTLETLIQGDPASTAFVFHHGGFGSSMNMGSLYRAAAELGVFCIGITRPGYAASSPRRGRRAHDYVLETKLALDHFGVTDFVSFGWSSGALGAISDTQDSRCKGAVLISGDAPRTGDDWKDYLSRYPAKNRPAPTYQPAPNFENENFDMWRNIDKFALLAILSENASEPDKKICEGLAGDELAASISYGMAAGDYGIIDDLTADNSEWGIDLESITQRIEIFHGEEDRMDTPAHGRYFADKIPDSQLRMYSDEGHISLIYNRATEIVASAYKLLQS